MNYLPEYLMSSIQVARTLPKQAYSYQAIIHHMDSGGPKISYTLSKYWLCGLDYLPYCITLALIMFWSGQVCWDKCSPSKDITIASIVYQCIQGKVC